jgi:hypothetical protein
MPRHRTRKVRGGGWFSFGSKSQAPTQEYGSSTVNSGSANEQAILANIQSLTTKIQGSVEAIITLKYDIFKLINDVNNTPSMFTSKENYDKFVNFANFAFGFFSSLSKGNPEFIKRGDNKQTNINKMLDIMRSFKNAKVLPYSPNPKSQEKSPYLVKEGWFTRKAPNSVRPRTPENNRRAKERANAAQRRIDEQKQQNIIS